MSELKVYHCNEWHNEYTEFYIKSEADKVIADLEESHKKEVEQLLIEIAELKKEKEYVIEHTAEVINGQESEIRELKARITELEEERRWRKCSEELPDDGAEVLATDGDGIWLCYKTTMSDGSPWFQPDGLPHIEGVTHWMPLPSAPKEEK